MQVFIIEDKFFSIDKNLIPVDSFLAAACKREWTDDIEVKIDMPFDEFAAVYEYLVNGRIISDSLIESLDNLCIATNIHEYPDAYWRIKLKEDYYRTHRNQSYKLIDYDTVSHLIASNVNIDSHVLKQRTGSIKDIDIIRNAETLRLMIERLLANECVEVPRSNVIIAGGAVLSCIFNTTVYDLDVFIYGLDSIAMNTLIHGSFDCYAYKTTNSINIGKVQIILRAYDSIEQILTGFDLDASGICYVPSERKVYLTERCLHALTTMTNYVDFDRFSTTYEHRLVKYIRKYFNIWIPHFNIANVNHEALLDAINIYSNYRVTSADDGLVIHERKEKGRLREKEHRKVTGHIQGIDSLLYRYMRLSSNKNLVRVYSDYEGSSFEGIDVQLCDFTSSIVVTNPHDQINGSFHRIVMKNYTTWYKGDFYNANEE